MGEVSKPWINVYKPGTAKDEKYKVMTKFKEPLKFIGKET